MSGRSELGILIWIQVTNLINNAGKFTGVHWSGFLAQITMGLVQLQFGHLSLKFWAEEKAQNTEIGTNFGPNFFFVS